MADLYELRGVSSQKEDVHSALKSIDKGLYPDAFCKIVPDFFAGSSDHCVIVHSDTAGTKPILAYLYYKDTGKLSAFCGLAQDALTMNLDDMVCSGLINGFVASATLSRNKKLIGGDIVKCIIESAEEFVQKLRDYGIDIVLAGGETADVGDVIRTLDVGYTVAGRFHRNEVIRVAPEIGDLILGFSSYGIDYLNDTYNSGIGCNGLTSARHDICSGYYAENYPESYDPSLARAVIYQGQFRLTDLFETNSPFGAIPLGEAILSPTLCYTPVIKKIIEKFGKYLHGIVHLTGGGATKRLKFGQGIKYLVDAPINPSPIFKLIQQAVPTPIDQMLSTFNMGCRMEIYLPDSSLKDEIIQLAEEFKIHAQIIGTILPTDSKLGKNQVEIHLDSEKYLF